MNKMSLISTFEDDNFFFVHGEHHLSDFILFSRRKQLLWSMKKYDNLYSTVREMI